MSAWRLVQLAVKAERTWRRLPPREREQLLRAARTTLREQGPVVASRLAKAVQSARRSSK